MSCQLNPSKEKLCFGHPRLRLPGAIFSATGHHASHGIIHYGFDRYWYVLALFHIMLGKACLYTDIQEDLGIVCVVQKGSS